MKTRNDSLLPLALAAMIAAAPWSAAVGAATLAGKAPAAASAAPAKQALRKFTLTTGMSGGKMVFLDEKGTANPVLRGDVGDTIEITVSSGEGAEHDIVIPDLSVHSAHFSGKGAPVKVSFQLTQAGKFAYFCSIPGHRQIGMEGVLEVRGPSPASAAAPRARPATALAATDEATDARQPGAIAPAAAGAVSIARDPGAVPAAVGHRGPQLVKYRIETVELEGRLEDGTTFTYWTFGRKVPGPMLRVRQGDTVEITLSNSADSKAIHSIDLHAVTGGMGGGEHTQVAPGQSKTVRFRAMHAGLFVYHCATPSVPHHISAGMYGMILVEPPQGLPKVDREFYVMQGELYTSHRAGTRGHQAFSDERADDELPTYYTFNGAVGALTKEFKMSAKVGETVRVYFGVGGPNKISSFHLIGEVFDKVYSEGSLKAVKSDVQTTLVAPGGATIVDIKLDYPGKYLLVDHALSRVGKGLAATLEVSGPADAAVYLPSDPHGAGGGH